MTGDTRRALVRAAATVVVGSLLLVDACDPIRGADVDRVRSARWLLETSCRPEVTAAQMDVSARILEDVVARVPDRPLPVGGGGGMWSATAVASEVARFLSHPVAPGRTLGGETPAAALPCRAYGPAIARRLWAAIAARPGTASQGEP
jgi:hypothetical protein